MSSHHDDHWLASFASMMSDARQLLLNCSMWHQHELVCIGLQLCCSICLRHGVCTVAPAKSTKEACWLLVSVLLLTGANVVSKKPSGGKTEPTTSVGSAAVALPSYDKH
jgi:hypothetical protein